MRPSPAAKVQPNPCCSTSPLKSSMDVPKGSASTAGKALLLRKGTRLVVFKCLAGHQGKLQGAPNFSSIPHFQPEWHKDVALDHPSGSPWWHHSPNTFRVPARGIFPAAPSQRAEDHPQDPLCNSRHCPTSKTQPPKHNPPAWTISSGFSSQQRHSPLGAGDKRTSRQRGSASWWWDREPQASAWI